MPAFNICDYGAVGDGKTYDTAAIQKTIDACRSSGGGTVVVPGGKTYLTGAFRLGSCVTFHVEGGATILAGDRREDYPDGKLRCLIEAVDARHIAITGMGEIDGRAHKFMLEELPYIYRGNVWRPHLIGLIGCKQVTVRDITIRNGANWGLHLVGCEDVVVHGVRIFNDLKVPNCDGIDPDHCKNVRISDCHVEAGDDCIVIKNTEGFAEYGPTENITVTGCTLMSTSAAIKIGTESVDDFRNIVFDSCVVKSSSRGLAIQLRDGGNVENVIFSNMVVETRLFYEGWWGRAEPIYVTAIHRSEGSKLGRIRTVRFSNILCRSENGAFIAGSPDSVIEDIVFDNVRIELQKWSKWPGGQHDRRPMGGDWRIGVTDHPTAGVYCEYARDVTLRNTKVVWGKRVQDDWGHALEAHSVEDLKLENFTGEAAHPGRDEPTLID